MRMVLMRTALALHLALFAGGLAQAQELAGRWIAKGPGIGGGAPTCLVELESGGFAKNWCHGSLAFATRWQQKSPISLELQSGTGERLGMAGGSSKFVLGKAGGQRFWMVRDNTVCGINAWGADICLDESDYGPPNGNAGKVTTIAGMGLRQTFDMKSPVLAKIPPNTCFSVYNCQQTNFGAIWCQADHGGKSGWVTKFFSEDDQLWANFLNGCS